MTDTREAARHGHQLISEWHRSVAHLIALAQQDNWEEVEKEAPRCEQLAAGAAKLDLSVLPPDTIQLVQQAIHSAQNLAQLCSQRQEALSSSLQTSATVQRISRAYGTL